MCWWLCVRFATDGRAGGPEPLGTATKPIASMYLPKRVMASGAKLDSDSGTAIGFAPLIFACGAPVLA